MTSNSSSFVRWFRDSSPYIHAHRGRTFVVSFSGEAVANPNFANHAHDIALLNSLGIRLVLVHGIRPQIEERLSLHGAKSHYKDDLRITDSLALQCTKEAAGLVRLEVEALLSMGLPNSPMSGAKLKVTSGNFVIAKPLGICDGIDFCHTGVVRRIDHHAIREKLDHHDVVLLSPVGFSPTGEIFNLSAVDVATHVAISLKADKLILMVEQNLTYPKTNKLVQQLTTEDAEALINTEKSLSGKMAFHLKTAVIACQRDVLRAHLINSKIDGVILQELFSRDGVGTLVSKTPFEQMRSATINDIGGILDLIAPLENKGVLVKRSREALETEIDDIAIIERDGLIVACAALHQFPAAKMGELACLALHPDYHGCTRGDRLLGYVEQKARDLGFEKLFVLTTQTTHWFLEHGFESSDISELPVTRQALYNYQRKSKILYKKLSEDR